jgi:SAM-dependent methyltransferase
MTDRDAALRANIAAYSTLAERKYVNGAPHLKHRSITEIYRTMVTKAVEAIGRNARDISVLELGAGSGLSSVPWFEHRVKLTAVDSSDSMLTDLKARARAYGVEPQVVVADALDFLDSAGQGFDIVAHVSMIHHIPDYLRLLKMSMARVSDGGCLVTFQDPLRYDRMPPGHHLLDRASYFIWRTGQGNIRRGLRTRWRRLRGEYSPSETVDFDEYHVVRNGVDSEAMMALLRPSFSSVELVSYWSTYSSFLQQVGERLRLISSFGILASGRKP